MTSPRPLRLLLYCGATEWGGAEVVLGHLLGTLGAHVTPSLLGVDRAVLDRVAAARPGTPVTVVPRIRCKRDVSAIRAHRRAMVAARPDIVQLNLPVPSAEPYSVLAALTLPRTRVVVVEHLPMAIRSRGIRLLKRWTAPRLAAHVAVGTATARAVEAISGTGPGSVRVVPNGAPTPSPALPPAPGRGGAHFVVGAVGRLHAQKGFDVLVRALAQVPDAHLVLVGDGPERAALVELAAALGVADRLTVTGWTESVSAWLPAFDVLAMPSRFEGLPLVLLEAMLSERAVVGTVVGSMGDALLDEVTGLVVPVDDEVALAGALARLRDDPGLRDRLGRSAGELARKWFTLEAMARAYDEVYDEVRRGR